jgi:diguanylate cyclase (GGDEF)-like protein
MQALAPRSPAQAGAFDVVAPEGCCVFVSTGDRSLLDALPIAAAVVERGLGGALLLVAWNRRLEEAIRASNSDRFDPAALPMLHEGRIAVLMSDFLDGSAEFIDELEFRDGDGLGARHFRMKLAPLPGDPETGNRRCLVSLVDRTVEVRAEQSLRAEMLRDSLTGLPNRLGFTETIEKIGTSQSRDLPGGAEHAVLVVDLLRFSRINESMGSLAGDELLITFARRLMSTLRSGDMLARTGGNEFGILVGIRRGRDDARAAADRIQQVLTQPFRLSELEIKVECAIGVALMNTGDDSEELFRNAQFAVKQAKHSGCPQIYEPGEASAARRRFSIETELRRALEKDEIKLFYQPMIDLKSGRVSGFEALARWTHADRGEISPTEFIPVAEESGLILSLGRWAMDRAAHTLAGWDAAAGRPLPFTVSVNLSAIQVARDDVANVVSSALRSSGLTGNRLILELTESSIVQDPGRAIRVFDALKALDTTVAMDDFGTGYSSLAYLQRLPIDVLKIDRSFVTGMMRDADSVAIVRAVLSLAEALGMSTTAEGIETVELATTLATLGCANGQGYYYAKPLEADAAFEYWASRSGTV